MGLSKFLKTDTWINFIGKSPGVYTLVAILILGFPIIFAVLYFFKFLDQITYSFLQNMYGVKSDFILIKNPVTCGLNTLTGLGFIQASVLLFKDRKKQTTLFIASLCFSVTAFFGFYLMFYSSVLYSLSLSTYVWTKVTNIIQGSITIIENVHKSFESKFYLKYLDNVKKNLNERGFNAFVNEVNQSNHQITNIVLTCSEEYYNNIHKILLKFCEGEETAKLLIGFLVENKLVIRHGYIYNESTTELMSSKEISQLFQEYVKDTKRVVSAKEFLNIEHLA